MQGVLHVARADPGQRQRSLIGLTVRPGDETRPRGRLQADPRQGGAPLEMEGSRAVGRPIPRDEGKGMGAGPLRPLRLVEHPQLPEQGARPGGEPDDRKAVIVWLQRMVGPAGIEGVADTIVGARAQPVTVLQISRPVAAARLAGGILPVGRRRPQVRVMKKHLGVARAPGVLYHVLRVEVERFCQAQTTVVQQKGNQHIAQIQSFRQPRVPLAARDDEAPQQQVMQPLLRERGHRRRADGDGDGEGTRVEDAGFPLIPRRPRQQLLGAGGRAPRDGRRLVEIAPQPAAEVRGEPD